MLGFIQGKLISKNADTSQIVVLAQNIGYEVTLPRITLENIQLGENLELWLHTHVREDIFALYGFLTDGERQFFKVLISVSGLGPKTAMALLGTHGVSSLVRMILEKNAAGIKSAPGVGQKLAEKIILELSGKIEKLSFLMDLKRKEPRLGAPSQGASLLGDLQSALQNLGYPPIKVKSALDGLFTNDVTLTFEDALKLTLKEMYRRDV